MDRNTRGVVAGLAGLTGLAAYDFLQPHHSIRRNFPVIGRARWLLEKIRPEIQQYFVEPDTQGRPFDRLTGR